MRVADLPHRGKVSLPSLNFIVGCDKLYTSIYLSMLWVKSYINVYIYIRTYKNYKMTKGWANSNEYMSIKVCSKLRNTIQWGFPPIQLLNDLAVTNRHIMKDLDGFPRRNCMFLIGMYMKLHEYTHTELSMETYPPRIWDHQCLFSHPRAPQQLFGDLRWDPQSKQKASNRKCRQKEVKLPKSTGEMIHKEREKSFVFMRHFLRLFLLPGTPSRQRISRRSICFGDFLATLDCQRVSRIVASIFHQSPSIGSMVLVYILMESMLPYIAAPWDLC
jgi:hypothetical protein